VKRQPFQRLRHVFQLEQAWWKYFSANQKSVRDIVVETMVKLFACSTSAMGFISFRCSNPECPHTKRICFSCKNRYCGSCGTKATAQWMQTQLNILPETEWVHITFTFPCEFWPLFEENRSLLNRLSALAAKACLKFCAKHGVTPGIFTAIHTHGRALNWHPHIHLSITLGGLTKTGAWKTVQFKKYALIAAWRYEITTLLRKTFPTLHIPNSLTFEGQHLQHWNAFLDFHYKRHWNIDLAKPTNNPKHTVQYLGRYLKRPPVSFSRILHYGDATIAYRFLSHQTGQHETIQFETQTFILSFIRHIHDKFFKVVRYYGFLANRVRKTLLPKAYEALQQTPKKTTPKITHAALLKPFINIHPLACILCNARMIIADFQRGMPLTMLKTFHFELATMRVV
jgi:hypothetical protein